MDKNGLISYLKCFSVLSLFESETKISLMSSSVLYGCGNHIKNLQTIKTILLFCPEFKTEYKHKHTQLFVVLGSKTSLDISFQVKTNNEDIFIKTQVFEDEVKIVIRTNSTNLVRKIL